MNLIYFQIFRAIFSTCCHWLTTEHYSKSVEMTYPQRLRANPSFLTSTFLAQSDASIYCDEVTRSRMVTWAGNQSHNHLSLHTTGVELITRHSVSKDNDFIWWAVWAAAATTKLEAANRQHIVSVGPSGYHMNKECSSSWFKCVWSHASFTPTFVALEKTGHNGPVDSHTR